MKRIPVLKLPAPQVGTGVQGSQLAIARGMLAGLRTLASESGARAPAAEETETGYDDARLPVKRSEFIEPPREAVD